MSLLPTSQLQPDHKGATDSAVTGARQDPGGSARIRGHVASSESGQALAKVLVRASGGGSLVPMATWTDTGGNFEFSELGAGQYMLSASRGGYVVASGGVGRAGTPAQRYNIRDGETLEGVNLLLARGGAIAGRVVDELGEPVVDVKVVPLRYEGLGVSARLLPSGRASLTNDLGEFRLFGLTPGQYYVAATLEPAEEAIGSSVRVEYAPTYYPGSADPRQARRIAVVSGRTAGPADLSLLATRTSWINGFVVEASGRPLLGGTVVAGSSSSGFGVPEFRSQVRADGSFKLGGLVPGKYSISIQAGAAVNEFASTEVQVGGEEITPVRLQTSPPVSLSGRIVVAQGSGALRPRELLLTTSPMATNEPPIPVPVSMIRPDLSFDLKSPPGRRQIELAGTGNRWLISAVRQSGSDVTDSGIDVQAAANLESVELEVTDRIATVSGYATNGRGERLRNIAVLIYPRDPRHWALPRFSRLIAGDRDGQFTARGLPPGEYLAVAAADIDPADAMDVGRLDMLRSRATVLLIGQGETQVILRATD